MNFHYFVPNSNNGRSKRQLSRQDRARRRRMSIKTFTFNQLKELMIQRVGSSNLPSRASLPNLVSALEQFSKERGSPMDSPIGSLLRISYYKARDAHLEQLKLEGRTRSYIGNRKNLLSYWRRLILAFDREHAKGQETQLQSALKELIDGGLHIRRLAREAGVPLATLRSWLAGTRPQRKSVTHLQKIERYAGMVSGTLVDHILPMGAQESGAREIPDRIAYRSTLRTLSADHFRLKPVRANEQFRAEWVDLVRFKTTTFTSTHGLLSDRYGENRQWRLLSKPNARLPEHPWVHMVNGRYCPSAELAFQHTAQYIGWLQLCFERGGLAMAAEDAQTLAHLCNEEYLTRFVDWRIQRSGGSINRGSSALLETVSTLCHPKYGFLVQRPDIGQKVSVSDPAIWIEQCVSTREFAVNAMKRLLRRQRPSRDPFEPIQAIIALDNPLEAITDALKRMDADRPMTGGTWEAIWSRDRLLLALTASNPLRARNLKELTYRDDNTGQLRRDADGGWRIVIRSESFKNSAGAAKDRDYDMPVQQGVWPYIDQYVKTYRPVLARSGTELVFVSSKAGDREWADLNRRYQALTRKYVHNCNGFGPHSIRHIVATGILKASGSVAAAALVLFDREDTVRKFYARLIPNDGAKWLDRYLGSAFRRM